MATSFLVTCSTAIGSSSFPARSSRVRRASDVRGDVFHDAWRRLAGAPVAIGSQRRFGLDSGLHLELGDRPAGDDDDPGGRAHGDLHIGGVRAGVLAALLPVTRVLVPVLKETFERSRPSAALVHVRDRLTDYSFSSGHAFNSMLIYGLFFYLATVYVKPRLLRHGVQAACLWVIVLTPMQRVYAGAHWPSDVLGGMVLAALVLSLGIAAHQWSLRLKRAVPVPAPAPPLATSGRQP